MVAGGVVRTSLWAYEWRRKKRLLRTGGLLACLLLLQAPVLNAECDRLAVSMVPRLSVVFLLSSRMSKCRMSRRRVRHGGQAIAVSI